MRTSSWLVILIACPALASCAITVPAPDLSFLEIPQTDPGSSDLGTDLGTDPGTDPGDKDAIATDPGGKDVVSIDPGDDPGTDPGQEVIVITPQNGGYPCTTNEECVSGTCAGTRCTCRDGNDCDKGLWCDTGNTNFAGTANCLDPRANFAGCTAHVQCKSGACSPLTGTGASYCTVCEFGGPGGGTGCDTTSAAPMCCGGICIQNTGCLADCGVQMPPAPQWEYCMQGCWDPATQYCSPGGPASKLGAAADCQFLNSWCLTNYCMASKDGKTSNCSCDDSLAPCRQGLICVNQVCQEPVPI